MPTRSGGTFTYEFGLFPLTQGGSRIEQFISVEDYFDFDATAAQLFANLPTAGRSRSSR